MAHALRSTPTSRLAVLTAGGGLLFAAGIVTGTQVAARAPAVAAPPGPATAVGAAARPPARAVAASRTEAVPEGPAAAPATGTRAARTARAAALHQQATELQMAGRWRRAAELHLRSAALHGADARAFACLQLAGNMLFYDGDLAGARATMQRAAAHALARGGEAEAADALLKAGVIAREQGDATGAAELAGRAEQLALSPQLTAAQRTSLLRGITRALPSDSGGAAPR